MSKKRLKKNSERLTATVTWVILPEVHGTSACNAQFNMVLHLIFHRSQTFLSDHQISVFFFIYNFPTACRSYEKYWLPKWARKDLRKTVKGLLQQIHGMKIWKKWKFHHVRLWLKLLSQVGTISILSGSVSICLFFFNFSLINTWHNQVVTLFLDHKKYIWMLQYRDFVEVMCSKTGNLNINERDGDGLTALYYAAGAGSVRFTEIKLKY